MANNDWQEFQFIQGAVFNNETIVSFGNIQNELLCAAQADIVCDLSHLATLALSGDDALTFLQGQVTNDVNLLGTDKAHYSGYCSPKGRLLALFLAYRLSLCLLCFIIDYHFLRESRSCHPKRLAGAG